MNEPVTVTAPGKIILTGEHFVVHGSFAVAAAINRRVRVTVKATKNDFSCIISGEQASRIAAEDGKFRAAKTVIRKLMKEFGRNADPFEVSITSNIPAGSGLGSSAALSVACTAAITKYLGKTLGPKDLFSLAMHGEREVHGNPSGIDVEASIRGGVILFSRTSGAKSVEIKKQLNLGVVYSGKKRSTARLVEKVARQKELHPHFFQKLIEAASYQSLELVDALAVSDLERVGFLFNIAQAELDWIGVSTPSLQQLIEKVDVAGTYGAKITGAGGGGSIIVAAAPESLPPLIASTAANYPHSFITSLEEKGVQWLP